MEKRIGLDPSVRDHQPVCKKGEENGLVPLDNKQKILVEVGVGCYCSLSSAVLFDAYTQD